MGILNPIAIPECSLGQLLVQLEEYKGSLLRGSHSKRPLEKGLYSCGSLEPGGDSGRGSGEGCRILLPGRVAAVAVWLDGGFLC